MLPLQALLRRLGAWRADRLSWPSPEMRRGKQRVVDRVDRVEQVVQPNRDLVIASQRHAGFAARGQQAVERHGDLCVFLVVFQRRLVVRMPGQPFKNPVELRPGATPGDVIVDLDTETQKVEFNSGSEPVDQLDTADERFDGVFDFGVLDFPSGTSLTVAPFTTSATSSASSMSSSSGIMPNFFMTSIRNSSST